MGEALRISSSSVGSLTLDTDDQGNILSTFNNACVIISFDNYWKGKFLFNLFSGCYEASGVYWELDPHNLRDIDLEKTRLHVSQVYGLSNEKNILQAIHIAAHDKAYHPIRNYLAGLKWDGKDRIPDLLPTYLGAERSEYVTAVTRLLFYSAIRRVFSPGCKYDTCIVLTDKKQGTGKSSMIKYLAIRDEWFTDNVASFDKPKEFFETIRGHWIIELGEMLATKKTDTVERIKSTITRQYDDYREPYAKLSQQYSRQCVFIGSTNKPDFLPSDPSGNRRFIPVACNGLRPGLKHPVEHEAEARADIIQCYAQAMVEGERDGWPLVLDHKFDEMLDVIREDSTPERPLDGVIQEYLDSKGCPKHVCSLMIRDYALDENDRNDKYVLRDISDFMNHRAVGWRPYKGKNGTSRDIKYYFSEYRITRNNELCSKAYGYQRAWERIPEDIPEDIPSGFENIPDDENLFI